MRDIRVGDRVKIRDFSGAVLGNDFTSHSYGLQSPGAKGAFEVLHTGMKLPSYDVTPGQNRFNDIVLRSTTDKRLTVFSQVGMLDAVNPPVTKYRVLYADFKGQVNLSNDFYADLTDFQVWNPSCTPTHLILETAKECRV